MPLGELDEAALLADADVALFDPGLESVTNLNDPHEYEEAALRPLRRFRSISRKGLGASVLAPDDTTVDAGASRRVTVRAATLGAAAEAIDVVLGPHLLARLNGGRVRRDPEEPLAKGDVVSFVKVGTGR